MKDLSYLVLRAFLYPREDQQSSVKFKLQELEQIWFCTQKNVKRKLKKFQEEGKCLYQPGKGRGNPSCITFTDTFHNEVKKVVKVCIENDQLEDLIHLMQLPIPKSWFTKFSEEIQTLFGLQSPNQSKDLLRTVLTRNVTTLNPLYTSITFESYLIQQLGDTLVTYNLEEDSIQPHIAHHWIVDESHTTWTFYLRKGVRFHHQRILVSEDVKFTFERFHAGSSPLFWLVGDIDKIACPSPFVVQFHLRKSNPFFLRYVSTANLAILPRDLPFDEYQWIGTGPFQLKERTDMKIDLKAFDHYFLERPLLDEIEFWRVPIETVKSVTYQVGSEESNHSILYKQDVEIGFRFLAFNFNKSSIVHHPSFRNALFHLLDMKKMWSDLGREDLVEASSFSPQNSKPQPKDSNSIAPLLKDSGYDREILTLYTLNNPRAVEEANWFVKEAEKRGIRLRLVQFNIENFYLNTPETEADMMFMGEVSSNDLHLSFLSAFYNESLLFRRFLSQENLVYIEESLEKFKRESDRRKREHWIKKVESYLRDGNLILFQHHPIKNRIFHSMIRDIRFESYGYVDFRKLWIQ